MTMYAIFPVGCRISHAIACTMARQTRNHTDGAASPCNIRRHSKPGLEVHRVIAVLKWTA